MKSVLTHGLGLALVALGFMAAAPTAYGQQLLVTNHAGSICKHSKPGEATLFEYNSNLTKVLGLPTKITNTVIICPLVRQTSHYSGATVFVDVLPSGTATTMTCTAFSYSDRGQQLGISPSQTLTVNAFQEFRLDLLSPAVGPWKSDPWSDYSVKCTIPGNRSVVILGVDLQEIND